MHLLFVWSTTFISESVVFFSFAFSNALGYEEKRWT
jgi:hypothetical protein